MELEVLLDNVRLNDYGKVRNVQRSLFGNIDPTFVKAPGKTGRYLPRKEKDEQYIVIDMILSGSDYFDVRNKLDNLKRTINFKDSKPLEVSDEPGKIYEVELVGETEYEPEANTIAIELEFTAPLGYGKSGTMTVSLTSSSTQIMYTGTHDSFPVITADFNGNASELLITNDVNGRTYSCKVKGDYISGDKVVIDCDEEYVTLNGTDHMAQLDIMHDFIVLEQGNNQIQYSVTSGTLPDISLSFTENDY